MVREDEFELVPEGKFAKMEDKLQEIFKSPVIKSKDANELSKNIQVSNESVKSLLEVLHKIAENQNFEETETTILKNQLKPFIRIVKNIKEQNETIANGMVNIIDRLNDLQNDILEIKTNIYPVSSPIVNPSLPPMLGGSTPPSNIMQESAPSFNSTPPPSMPSATPEVLPSALPTMPPPIEAKNIGGIPPMDMGGMKKKGLFK